MKKVLIIGTILMMAGVVMGQNYGTIGMPGGTITGGELDSIQVTILQYQESDGVDGDTLIPNTWDAYTVNTELIDEIGVTIIGDSAYTLPAGKYLISAYYTADVISSDHMQSRFYNITSTSVISKGLNRNPSNGSTFINLSSPANICFQTIATFSVKNTASSFSEGVEVYGEVKIMKLN